MSKRILGRSVAAFSALVLSVAFAGTAQAATPPQYVAIGDSYASGDGAGSYLSDGTSCYRSSKAYPALIATASGFALNLQACSGANTADVLSRQLGTLSASTAYVTITVGGNDIGFASVLTACLGTSTSSCNNALAAAEAKIANELPAKLDSVFAAVKAKAPAARIVATNYPRLFNGKDCSLLTSFTSAEMTRLNADADKLSTAISAAASRAGIRFADVRTPFVKHAVCDSSAWIRNVQLFSQHESFHPNATGQQSGYRPPVSTALNATSVSGNGQLSVTTGGQTSSDTSRGRVKVNG